jgi:hypothetical protein
MVAEFVVMFVAVTEVITGADGADAPVVAKVKFTDVASVPVEFLDSTA